MAKQRDDRGRFRSGPEIQPASAAVVTQRDLTESLQPIGEKVDKLAETVTGFVREARADHHNLAKSVDSIVNQLTSSSRDNPGVLPRVAKLEIESEQFKDRVKLGIKTLFAGLFAIITTIVGVVADHMWGWFSGPK